MEAPKPISFGDYSMICDLSGGDVACNPVDRRVVGPKEIIFSTSKGNGIPLRTLLNPSTANLIEGAKDEAIRVFLDNGVADIRVVIWGPERAGGKWTHQVRRIPVVSSTGVALTNKGTLGLLVASEYNLLCARLERRVPGGYKTPDLNLGTLLLVAVKQIAWNVYQVELDIPRPSARRLQ